jgi:hypothetical protein
MYGMILVASTVPQLFFRTVDELWNCGEKDHKTFHHSSCMYMTYYCGGMWI